jgi:DNA polymerase II
MGELQDVAWKGYIVHTWTRRGQLRLAGRLEDGSSFAAILPAPPARRFRPDPEGDWETFDGTRLNIARSTITQASSGTPRYSQAESIETGLPPAQKFLLFNGIRGTVTLRGPWTPGRRVHRVFNNPEIRPSDHRPSVVWAAVDIETDRQEQITAVSIVSGKRETVFLVPLTTTHPPSPDMLPRYAKICRTEGELLAAFAETIREWDPDIITGWNVTDFDFSVLARRYAALSLPFDLGRAEDEVARIRKTQTGRTHITIPGRQVVDAMRIVRGSGRDFDDYRLDTVATEVLGRGKTVRETDEEKLAELDRLRREDLPAFCRYSLEDSRLVLDILSETGLDTLTLVRSTLTGMEFDRAWTSIPAFERIYALELVRRNILPPREAGQADVSGAAGGTVLDATPGLFTNVLVFDFRSLYPSVMRTFNIDPLVYERAKTGGNGTTDDGAGDSITAPNGARFSRNPGILPALLDTYFHAREEALVSGDTVAAYVYKILMNSFYGVLGSSGCIYGRTELAGAITGFGRYCLLFARDFFREKGMTVLYGDTDSVFVYAGGADLGSRCDALARELNEALSREIRETYGVPSRIAIRCDVVYRRFLLPRLRSVTATPVIRGRAKGYAGLVAETDGDAERVDIKGMEAARSDYTALARRFQRELLDLLFHDAGTTAIDAYVRGIVADLLAGRLDSELVYRKILRRPAREYTHAASPQVRAARKLGWTTRRGRVEYVMTTAGPEPLQLLQAPPDYRHYIDHQLRPIWLSVAEAADLSDTLTRAEPDGSSSDPKHRLQDLSPLDDQLQLGL